MMRHKRVLAGLVLAALVLAAGAAAAQGIVLEQKLNSGTVLDSIGFGDGSMLVISANGLERIDYLTVEYYDREGTRLLRDDVILDGLPSSIMVHVCGGYVQIVASYQAKEPLNYYAGWGERFVMYLDQMPTTCLERVYLPVVTK